MASGYMLYTFNPDLYLVCAVFTVYGYYVLFNIEIYIICHLRVVLLFYQVWRERHARLH